MKSLFTQAHFLTAILTELSKLGIYWFGPSYEEAKALLNYKTANEWILVFHKIVEEGRLPVSHILKKANSVHLFYEERLLIRAKRLGLINDIPLPIAVPEQLSELNALLSDEDRKEFVRRYIELDRDDQDRLTVDINRADLDHYIDITLNSNDPNSYGTLRSDRFREDIVVRLVCGLVLYIDELSTQEVDELLPPNENARTFNFSNRKRKSPNKEMLRVVESLDIPSFQAYLGLPDEQATIEVMFLVLMTALGVAEQLPHIQAKYIKGYLWGKSKKLVEPKEAILLKVLKLRNFVINNSTNTISKDYADEMILGIIKVTRGFVEEYKDLLSNRWKFYQNIRCELLKYLPKSSTSIIYSKPTIRTVSSLNEAY